MSTKEKIDYTQPVAYDKDGRPLYAHPPAQSVKTGGKSHKNLHKNSDIAKRHKDSSIRYPNLRLSEEQYVVAEVKRHTVGIVLPAIVAGFLGILVIAMLLNYSTWVPSNIPSASSLVLPVLLLLALIGMSVYIVAWVYLNNRLYLTNESIIQQIQLNLFAHSEQVVDLSDVKDISYRQTGILQMLLDYGVLELSTEGEDKVYKFTNVSNPRRVIAMLNNAIEDAKNGRPVGGKYIDD